jgi:ADP-ribose pyrophosphatase
MQPVVDPLAWAESSRTRISSCALFDMYAVRSTAADGRSGEFCLLTAADWVNVVPVIRGADGRERFLMVRQFRHGAGMVTTEFPAGLVEKGEPPDKAALRELAEETGRIPGRLTLLGRVAPNPAFMSNWCYTYLAEELSPAGRTSLDHMEVLEPLEVPAEELHARLGTGELVNSLVLVAVLLYLRHRSSPA